jgi:hypothetical protein
MAMGLAGVFAVVLAGSGGASCAQAPWVLGPSAKPGAAAKAERVLLPDQCHRRSGYVRTFKIGLIKDLIKETSSSIREAVSAGARSLDKLSNLGGRDSVGIKAMDWRHWWDGQDGWFAIQTIASWEECFGPTKASRRPENLFSIAIA